VSRAGKGVDESLLEAALEAGADDVEEEEGEDTESDVAGEKAWCAARSRCP
jgi:transcriptional/translational regulatory protein YebC/TACO1